MQGAALGGTRLDIHFSSPREGTAESNEVRLAQARRLRRPGTLQLQPRCETATTYPAKAQELCTRATALQHLRAEHT